MNPPTGIAAAAEAYHRDDFTAAEVQCRRILARRPDDADAMHLLGLVRRKLGDDTEAEQLLRESIARKPQIAQYRVNLSNLLRADGRLRDAEAELRAALAAEPESRVARVALLRVLNDLGEAMAARLEADRLIDRHPGDAEAWQGLATAQRHLGSFDEAESSYRKALKIRPDYAIARHNYGSLLCETQQAERALEELDKAAQLGIHGAEANYNRASALFTLGRFDDAETALLEALGQSPVYADAHMLLAKLRYMRGDRDFTRDLAAAARTSGDLGLNLALGDVLLRSERLGEAADVLMALMPQHENVAEIAANLAVVRQEQGQLSAALEHALNAYRALPKSADVASTLVAILLQLGEPEQALPVISEQRRLRPNDQRWIAYAATAARLLGNDDYPSLYDYERFVAVFDLPAPAGYGSTEAFNRTLAERLDRLHTFETHPLDQSLRHGTQTARDLRHSTDPVIRAFFAAVQEPLRQYRQQLGHEPSHPFLARNTGEPAFAGCWSVRLRQGGFHVNHVHPKGWISSAYYVDVPEEVGDDSTRPGWLKFGEPRRETPGAEPAWYVQPRPGRLVLFPSYLWHGTVPLCGQEPRLALAFDVIPGDEP